VLRTFDTLAFEDVVVAYADTESSRSKCKLDPELQQAMIFAANLSQSQVRTLKTHFCYSNMDTLQPETATRRLQISEFVKPMSIEFKDGGTRKRPAWHMPVDALSLTNADMDEVRTLVRLLDNLWRRMFSTVPPPKAHAWWHLVDNLERFRGPKHHQESKIEVSHQVGKRVDLLFWAVNDIDKKIDCSLRCCANTRWGKLQ